jgi:uncharacterized membrane protein
MTAFAFILGTIPLAIASGAGAVARRILGTAVIGGMLAATLLAIFIIPVAYYAMEHLKDKIAARKEWAVKFFSTPVLAVSLMLCLCGCLMGTRLQTSRDLRSNDVPRAIGGGIRAHSPIRDGGTFTPIRSERADQRGAEKQL